jgi:hypothetical protein
MAFCASHRANMEFAPTKNCVGRRSRAAFKAYREIVDARYAAHRANIAVRPYEPVL